MAQSRAHKEQSKRGEPSRNYKSEYQNYQGKPEQIKNRSMRNQARRMYEKEHGDLPTSVDVDHHTPIVRGGGNDPTNLRGRSSGANRSFPRNRRAGMKAR